MILQTGETLSGRVQLFHTYSFRDGRGEQAGVLELEPGSYGVMHGDRLRIKARTSDLGLFFVQGANVRWDAGYETSILVHIIADEHVIE